MMRGWRLIGIGLVAIVAVAGLTFSLTTTARLSRPIVVGLVHSRTGPSAVREQSLMDAELLALEEINRQGGLLGRPVRWVVADGRSSGPVFGEQARRLIEVEKACVLFGGRSSSSRQALKSVVEESDHLLIFAMASEGMEDSPNIVTTGSLPNQQVAPVVRWSFEVLKARKYGLVGSDCVWSRAVNALIKDLLKAIGAELAYEEYLPLGGLDRGEIAARLKQVKPDVVLSTVVDESNAAFYGLLSQAGMKPDRLPVISFTVGEEELRTLSPADLVGDYSALAYFQGLDRPENRAFVARFKARYGQERVTSDVIEAAYNGVWLWAQAVAEAGNDDVRVVRKYLRRQSRDAPEGIITVDSGNLYAWKPISVGRVRSDGQFDIVWTISKPVRPVPYPFSRSREDWDTFHHGLQVTPR